MHFFSLFTFLTLLHVLIITGVSIRIIAVRLPVTVSLAWLILVFFLPLVGAIAYLVLGEKRLGRKFEVRSQAIKARYDKSGNSGRAGSVLSRTWLALPVRFYKIFLLDFY